jgi:hypothetical protein
VRAPQKYLQSSDMKLIQIFSIGLCGWVIAVCYGESGLFSAITPVGMNFGGKCRMIVVRVTFDKVTRVVHDVARDGRC